MRGSIPPLPIRLHGVVLSLKKAHGSFTFLCIYYVRIIYYTLYGLLATTRETGRMETKDYIIDMRAIRL
jgi:hypothetical protein